MNNQIEMGMDFQKYDVPILQQPNRRFRKRWSDPSGDPESRNQLIKDEATQFVAQYGSLTIPLLKKHDRKDLAAIIERLYPGKLTQMIMDLGLGIDKLGVNGRIRWAYFKERKPEEFKEFMLDQCKSYISSDGKLNIEILKKAGKSGIGAAIAKHYPGGIRQLQQDLGVRAYGKRNYWTVERVEEEAESFFLSTGKLTQSALNSAGRSDLLSAITNHYEGGLTRLQGKFNISFRKPEGYWTQERILEEARSFYVENGTLNSGFIKKNGRSDLANAIFSVYKGGMFQLRTDLGVDSEIKKPGEWTVELIENDALSLFQQEGNITQKILQQKGSRGLASAISQKYPGGLWALREKIGAKSSRKPIGYWTVDRIETEALKYLEEYSSLASMTQNGRYDLRVAIYDQYPGGLNGLKEKLGIKKDSIIEIPADQANLQLQNLLGGNHE